MNLPTLSFVISGLLFFPIISGAGPAITGPIAWGQGKFFNPTGATVCLENYRHNGSSPLCLTLEREGGHTKFLLHTGICKIYGDAKDVDIISGELKEMLGKARDWAEKARANNISQLEEKVLFTFTRASTQPRPAFGLNGSVLEPASFAIFTEGGRTTMHLRVSAEAFEEQEWPALQLAAEHMKDMIPKFEAMAIPAEQAQAAEKQKKDSLFKP